MQQPKEMRKVSLYFLVMEESEEEMGKVQKKDKLLRKQGQQQRVGKIQRIEYREG